MKAIVNFRTLPNGAYKWMRGLRRGYWRVLIVRDPAGSKNINSKNVTRVDYSGPSGIDGVTERSNYYIGDSFQRACEIAKAINNAL